MPILKDYIEKQAKTSFADLPLNELDIIAINEIGYLSFDELAVATIDETTKIKIKDIDKNDPEDRRKTIYNYLITQERLELFEAIQASQRFEDLTLSHYVNEINKEFEKQFAAMVFTIPSINHVQIVFRGTDDSLIGWKEDFKLTYMSEIPAHRSAIHYVRDYVRNHPDQKIYLTGHSKGGNLALYASSFSLPSVQEKIKKVYLLDSPGIAEELLQRESYMVIRNKLVVVRPQESVVGVMLYCDVKPKVVKSLAFGVLQHKTCNWQVHLEGKLATVPSQTELSLSLEKTFRDWTRQLSKQDLKLVCDSFFDALIASGITSLNAFTFDEKSFMALFKVISSLNSIDQAKKAIMYKSIRQLIHDYTGYRKRDVSEKIQARISNILKKRPNQKLLQR
ncbi:lipase [Streptococcus penaeicida]|uniref:Lipase n=1 Tax=Streptococcus penaeicida TaxID=1765960 RepID=A0A2N8LD57_9STRE|nr:Mbeg1-like protein [Streptococcus penaeicida]PND48103.1 lipase [Streptococcus penaeicida]